MITYNEDVTCAPGAVVAGDFVYAYTGSATGFDGAVTAACATDQVTLTAATSVRSHHCQVPISSTPSPRRAAVLSFRPRTRCTPPVQCRTLYAATQTLSAGWTTPAITAAAVSAACGDDHCYLQRAVVCPTTLRQCSVGVRVQQRWQPRLPVHVRHCCRQLVLGWLHDRGIRWHGSDSGPAGCFGHDHVHLACGACRCDRGAQRSTSGRSSRQRRRSSPGATAAPVMQSFGPGIANAGGTTLTITYQEPVSCPATGADGDFVYDSAFNTVGGSVTGCASGAGDTLVLSGLFNPQRVPAPSCTPLLRRARRRTRCTPPEARRHLRQRRLLSTK